MAIPTYRNLLDEELLHKISIKQDPEALDTLYKRYAHQALGVCLNYMEVEQAKLFIKNIFDDIWNHAGEFQIVNFRAWLFNALLKNSKTIDPNAENQDFVFLTEDIQRITQHISKEKLTITIRENIKTLPKDQQFCLYYFYQEQLTQEQIAEKVNLNSDKIKELITLGRTNLIHKIAQNSN